MSYKVLYRKYRPDNFDNVVGQDYTVKMLKNAIITGKNAHAYIFTGPRGTGKTSSAKIFAKALNCSNPIDGNPCNECEACKSFKDNPDIIEIDAASNNGVDEIRELINNVKLVPTNSKYKVYIIDEVHMLTASAFNALLLTLEEPPSHVVFILATTDIQDVPITILSRCQRFDFKPVNKAAIINRLKYICSEESISINDDAIEEIAVLSAGGMRDALGMLDQLSSDDKTITLDDVSSYFGSVSIKKIDELLTSIDLGNTQEVLNILREIKDSGTNYAVFIEKLIDELRKTAINIKEGNINTNFYFDDIYNLIFDLNECLCNININIDPYILIEIVLLKYVKSTLGNNTSDNLGNKLGNNFVGNSEKYNPGNKEIESLGNNINNNPGNNVEVLGNKLKSKKEKVLNKSKIDLSTRINNCFVEATKNDKSVLSKQWDDFIKFLMKKDKSLVSLLADTIILTASCKYVLIESKIDSTNELINNNIVTLEDYFFEFSGNKLKFAAINSEIWQKETEKYRFNLKNKIKYSYVPEDEEESAISNNDNDSNSDLSTIEDVAKDIFGTFDIK